MRVSILPTTIAGCVVLLFGLGVADTGRENKNTTTSKTETSELDLTELNMTRAKAWGLSL